jgi:hypothetical protein
MYIYIVYIYGGLYLYTYTPTWGYVFVYDVYECDVNEYNVCLYISAESCFVAQVGLKLAK